MPAQIDHPLRDRIATAITEALSPRVDVLAGWKGGSVAFGTADGYSDIDLYYLVSDNASPELLYALAARALETVSPITMNHAAAPGRYYKLADTGEFLLVDLIFVATSRSDQFLEVERHGQIRPLFDKGGLAPDHATRFECGCDRSREKASRTCGTVPHAGISVCDISIAICHTLCMRRCKISRSFGICRMWRRSCREPQRGGLNYYRATHRLSASLNDIAR